MEGEYAPGLLLHFVYLYGSVLLGAVALAPGLLPPGSRALTRSCPSWDTRMNPVDSRSHLHLQNVDNVIFTSGGPLRRYLNALTLAPDPWLVFNKTFFYYC